jgi:signal peptidase I
VWIDLAAYDLRVPFAGWIVFGRAEPARGDLVLCVLPDGRSLGIKRMLGEGGDTVEFRDDRLAVNGHQASYRTIDPGLFRDVSTANLLGDDFAIESIDGNAWMISRLEAGSIASSVEPITVPDGHYFVAGDNRASSWDSRFSEFGCVPRTRILGRVIGSGRPIPADVD